MKTYDPKNYDLIVGDRLISGFGEGTFISISTESPGMSDTVGVDGVVTRSRSHDRRATMTITLMASSESNDFLSGLYQQDRDGQNGEGVVAVSLVNREGSDEFRSEESWIMDDPDPTFEAEVGEREWQIKMAYYKPSHGSIPDA